MPSIQCWWLNSSAQWYSSRLLGRPMTCAVIKELYTISPCVILKSRLVLGLHLRLLRSLGSNACRDICNQSIMREWPSQSIGAKFSVLETRVECLTDVTDVHVWYCSSDEQKLKVEGSLINPGTLSNRDRHRATLKRNLFTMRRHRVSAYMYYYRPFTTNRRQCRARPACELCYTVRSDAASTARQP